MIKCLFNSKKSLKGFLCFFVCFLSIQGQANVKSTNLSLTNLVNYSYASKNISVSKIENITGTVTDSNGELLPGVSIKIKGSKTATVTDINGVFRLNLPTGNETLVVSYLGFNTQEIAVAGRTKLTIVLTVSTSKLDEVIVTGYGSKKRSEIVGSVATITGEEIQDIPAPNIAAALRGRIAGVGVNQISGRPGSSISLNVRGSSVSETAAGVGVSSEPLYIIDGVPTPDGDFQTLNPNDFESITVLKDASAAALYGARGGTGVIVITSKRGKAGKNVVTYKTQYGVTQRPSFARMNLMNTREMLAYEEREKLVGTPGWNWSKNNPVIPAGMTAASKQFSLDSLRNIDIDYANIFYREGISKSHELTLSGGSDRTKFFLSGAYFDQEGIDIYSSLKRYTLRFNLDHSTDKFTAQFNSTIGYSKSQLAEGDFLGNSPRSPFQMTYRAKTYENPYKPDGSLNWGASTSMAYKQVANLLEGLQNTTRGYDQIKMVGNGLLAYKLFPTLTVRNNLGVNASSNYVNRYVNADSYIGSLQSFQSGVTQESGGLYTEFINTSSLAYSEKFGKSE